MNVRIGLISALAYFFYSIGLMAAETASVLPKNIFRARIVKAQTSKIEDKFDSSGKANKLSKPLNQSISTHNFTASNPELLQLVNALDAIDGKSGSELLSTQLYSSTKMNVETYLAALEYGASEKLTLGIRVPVVKTQIYSQFSANSINNAKALQRKMGSRLSPDIDAGLKQVAGLKLDTAFFKNTLFTSKGYAAPSDYQKTSLGDVEMGAKYNFHNKPDREISLQLGLRAPTGEVKPIDQVFYQGTGEGAWAVGALILHDYHANKNWILGSMLKGVYSFPDTRKRAVPKSEEDSLPSLLEEDGQIKNVTRKQAIDMESELSATYNFNHPSWSTWGALQYSMSGKDQYYGSGNLYYEGLSTNSDFAKTDFELGFSYSTIPQYRAKSFPVPIKIDTMYKSTLQGINVAKVNYVRVDMIVFF